VGGGEKSERRPGSALQAGSGDRQPAGPLTRGIGEAARRPVLEVAPVEGAAEAFAVKAPGQRKQRFRVQSPIGVDIGENRTRTTQGLSRRPQPGQALGSLSVHGSPTQKKKKFWKKQHKLRKPGRHRASSPQGLRVPSKERKGWRSRSARRGNRDGPSATPAAGGHVDPHHRAGRPQPTGRGR